MRCWQSFKIMDKTTIQRKIDRNRELINGAVTSDLDPSLKKMLITNLSKQNENLIERLKQ